MHEVLPLESALANLADDNVVACPENECGIEETWILLLGN